MSTLLAVKKGATGPPQAVSQGVDLAAELYGEWQLSRVLAVGFQLEYALDLSSTVDDVAVAPRIRLGYPVRDWIYPYLVAALGPGQLHTVDVSLPGLSLSAGFGTSVHVSDPFWVLLEVGYDYTSFSGEAPLFADAGGAPVVHADIRTSFLAIGAGLELRF